MKNKDETKLEGVGSGEGLDVATSPSGMTYFNPEKMRHDAEEYDACMMAMDAAGVPRVDPTFGATYSIFGRAQWMARNVYV